MQTLWLDYDFAKKSKLSFLFSNIGYQNAETPDVGAALYQLQNTIQSSTDF